MGKKTMRIQSLDELLGLEPEEISPPSPIFRKTASPFFPLRRSVRFGNILSIYTKGNA